MEATYVGIHMWAQAVEEGGTTKVDTVRAAMARPDLRRSGRLHAEDGRDATTTCWKPVMIGEVQANGQFSVVWKTTKTHPRPALEPVHPRQ